MRLILLVSIILVWFVNTTSGQAQVVEEALVSFDPAMTLQEKIDLLPKEEDYETCGIEGIKSFRNRVIRFRHQELNVLKNEVEQFCRAVDAYDAETEKTLKSGNMTANQYSIRKENFASAQKTHCAKPQVNGGIVSGWREIYSFINSEVARLEKASAVLRDECRSSFCRNSECMK